MPDNVIEYHVAADEPSSAEVLWRVQCMEITEQEFWDDMYFAPINRMGSSDGPGAVFHGEPSDHRICTVTGKRTPTHVAHFVVNDGTGESRFYRFGDPITLEEFKALCAIGIPGVGPCAMGWGADP